MDRKWLVILCSFFLLLNVFLYVFINQFHALFPLSTYNYLHNAHHYLVDERITKGKFDLLRSLGQYDAQWYLRIAEKGYPLHPDTIDISDKSRMDALSYAFFPFYPFLLVALNTIFSHIELTAFVFSNLLLVLNFFSLFYVIKQFYSDSIAFKTIFLLFLFPLSIFFRSYFTEPLILCELIWFCYFLHKKMWLSSAIILGLCLVTRGTGVFLLPVFLSFLWQRWKEEKVGLGQIIGLLSVSLLPLLLWIGFCYIQTGNGLYFLAIRKAWGAPAFPLMHNLSQLVHLPWLPVHDFHNSQLDLLVMIGIFCILLVSKKRLSSELWWVSLALWIGPLLTTDTMSYARYQTILFPVFLYLALVLKNKYLYPLLAIFSLGLLFTGIAFVNWYWIG